MLNIQEINRFLGYEFPARVKGVTTFIRRKWMLCWNIWYVTESTIPAIVGEFVGNIIFTLFGLRKHYLNGTYDHRDGIHDKLNKNLTWG